MPLEKPEANASGFSHAKFATITGCGMWYDGFAERRGSCKISIKTHLFVLFCIYGAFLSEFGAGEFLFKLSSAITRKFVAATAKTAILFNLLIGMISGSAAGNVAITGTLTIPMMAKRGYSKEKAGAITAVAATGAQIMPPVMGAAAFIMAEITGQNYTSIMKAAIIPALLFFATLVIICNFEARKGQFDIYQEDVEYDGFGKVLREGWYYLVPIITLVAMLIVGYSPFKAAYFSSLALIVVYLAAKIAANKGASKELLLDVGKRIIRSIQKGTVDTGSLAIACAASGIIVGVLSITGLGAKLSLFIVTLSGGNALIALILTMLTSIVLGMGLPTTTAYLVLASVVVPALVNMQIPLIAEWKGTEEPAFFGRLFVREADERELNGDGGHMINRIERFHRGEVALRGAVEAEPVARREPCNPHPGAGGRLAARCAAEARVPRRVGAPLRADDEDA